MTNESTEKVGPQGTQVFEVNEINKMIAKEIVDSQKEGANLSALIGISHDVIGQQYILNKNKIEVGRRPNSDIVLSNSSVSSMHAQVINQDGYWKVLNLLSSNGTYVNGEKVAEKIISIGDLIAFAGSEFVYSMVEDETVIKSESSNKSVVVIAGLVVVSAIVLFLFL